MKLIKTRILMYDYFVLMFDSAGKPIREHCNSLQNAINNNYGNDIYKKVNEDKDFYYYDLVVQYARLK